MAATKTVWGIDLGQCALKAIRLRAVEGKVEAVDHVYLEHARILSQPDADRPALIAEAMKKFIDQHDLSKETLVVGVPGQHTLARFTKLPPVDRKKIPELVVFEAQQQIPFDMEEVIWDYQVFHDPEAMETEVGIFAMRRDLLREHLYPLSTLNLEPAAVQSAPLALFNALKFDGVCGAEPVCILDIGAQNTDLIVVEGNSLWTRNIPIGGNNFTEALLKTFKLSFRKAEKLKRDAQKHKYARQIFQAMRPAFADLVAEVQRSIGFFTSSRRGVKLGKIIAMGSAFKLPGMVKFIQQNLGMDVVRPTTFSKLSTGEAPNAPQLIDQLLSFGVAYGLALQGLGLAQITSSLLPPEIAKQVVWRKKTPWFCGAAACLVLSAALVWGRNIIDQGAVEEARGSQGLPTYTAIYGEKDPERKNPQPSPQACRVVQDGPSASTPVGKAREVFAAANHLSQVRSDIETRNDARIAEAGEIATLQSNKLVWPAIVDLIHSALPAPDDELAKALASGPEAYKALINAKPEKYNRGDRKQIFIERLSAAYSPDVLVGYREQKGRQGRSSPSSSSLSPVRGGMQDRGVSANPLPGFVINLTIRTPSRDEISFVKEAFLDKLRGGAYPKDTHPKVVRFERVELLWREQIRKRAGDDGFGVTRRTNWTGERDPGTAEIRIRDDTNTDPVTGESILNDWEFGVIIAAVVGDKPVETGGTGSTNWDQ